MEEFLNFSACEVNSSHPLYKKYNQIQKESSLWVLYYSLANGGPGIFANILVGSYSDRLGRRFILTLSIFGNIVKIGISTCIVHLDASLIYITLGYLIDGMTGYTMNLYAGVFAYVSDISPYGTQRTIGIVMSEITLAVAYTIASFSSGYFIPSLGYMYSMLFSAGCSILALMQILLCLPETIPSHGARQRLSFLNTISNAVKFYVSREYIGVRWKYILLTFSLSFFWIGNLGRAGIEPLYQLGLPVCWDSKSVGNFGALRVGVQALASFFATITARRFCTEDSLVILGVVSNLGSYVLEALAQTDAQLYAVTAVGCFSFIVSGMIRSLLSHLTPPERQGALFAGIAAMETICSLISNLSGNAIYAATVSFMSGFVFLVCAGQILISLVFVVMYKACKKCCERQKTWHHDDANVRTST
ncbi:hypothetical protein CHS0354_027673 [Potamilus streckersoni]|uniref:Major facilitator superfamily (MFS) profile domain-containing protein n=1 Tax=Potamilus streckersoni TaxID=2493646 RepID=A0AAE0W4T0_9BIVA|nr:hypothetical protein CHS0354_027673 [Potamilus streckersoni]